MQWVKTTNYVNCEILLRSNMQSEYRKKWFILIVPSIRPQVAVPCSLYLLCNYILFSSFKMSSPLIQYIVLRSDLSSGLKWPMGAVVAQGCHASAAALHIYRDDELTKTYLENTDSMRKVVLDVRSWFISDRHLT